MFKLYLYIMKILTLQIRVFSIITVLFFLTTLSFGANEKKEPGDFYEELSRLNKVLSEVNKKYVEEVDPAELSEAALQGIKTILDPHTVVFGPKDYENLKVSMEGEFGGVGITISLRDNILTVVSPLAGTPAFNLGIRAGDRIRKIEGKDSKGMTLDEAVSQLRGKVGTDVTIAIEREGVPELMDFTITRAKIVVHAVPYSGMLDKSIGYIKLATFSDKTTYEVERAIESLKKQGMKKLVLDLRYNPGGLLNQAIEIGELFLKKGNVIVSTRGRTQKTESFARRDGILGPEVPLVILVNQGSASASEIVAGAIQDWDRGLIIGKTSFGKGSVQTIFPLDRDGNALKLTTAFYYLPFGRCINKPENGIKGQSLLEEQEMETSTDSLAAKDTVKVDTFTTNNGRKMFGAGGIAPDIDIELLPMPWVVQVQERMAMYFKFAVKIRPALEASGTKIDANWNVPDSLLLQFKKYCELDTNYTKVKSNALVTLDILKETILKEQQYMGDSSKTISDTMLAKRFSELNKVLELQRSLQFEQNKQYIKDGIKRELLTAIAGDSVSTAFMLKSDVQVKEAIKYLSNIKLYEKAIKPVKAKSTKNKAANSKKK